MLIFMKGNSQLNGLFDLLKWAKLVAAAEAAKDKVFPVYPCWRVSEGCKGKGLTLSWNLWTLFSHTQQTPGFWCEYDRILLIDGNIVKIKDYLTLEMTVR